MRPLWQAFLTQYLIAFVTIFVVFTVLRYFGFMGLTETEGDLAASMAAELGPSLLWALVLAAVRVLIRRR